MIIKHLTIRKFLCDEILDVCRIAIFGRQTDNQCVAIAEFVLQVLRASQTNKLSIDHYDETVHRASHSSIL